VKESALKKPPPPPPPQQKTQQLPLPLHFSSNTSPLLISIDLERRHRILTVVLPLL